jgi:hypothetical protein
MTPSDDCFIMAKIHCLHRGQVLKKPKEMIEEILCHELPDHILFDFG